jgi:signal transduction histidine kinase
MQTAAGSGAPWGERSQQGCSANVPWGSLGPPVRSRAECGPGTPEDAECGDEAHDGARDGRLGRDGGLDGGTTSPVALGGEAAASALTLAVFAHEARSPLAVSRGALETLQRAHDAGAELRERLVEMALRGLVQLEALVGHLLEGVGSDEQLVAGGTLLVALSVVAERAAASCRSPGRVVIDADDVRVFARPALLAHAILLLVDNALRHSDGEVVVRTQGTEFGARIIVDDTGPGIAPGDRERVFELGWRGGGRRARAGPAEVAEIEGDPVGLRDDGVNDRGEDVVAAVCAAADGGLGIGLGLVDRIARLHGGLVYVTDAPSGGARFVIELPQPELAQPGP